MVTFSLVNPPGDIHNAINFAINMYLLVFAGMELERFYGQKKFLILYAGIFFLTPLVFTLFGLFMPVLLMGQRGSFALFVAFAVLYPGVAFLFGILAKWVAII